MLSCISCPGLACLCTLLAWLKLQIQAVAFVFVSMKQFYHVYLNFARSQVSYNHNAKKFISATFLVQLKKGSMKKVVKSKVAAQKWLWWSDNGKFLIATIQVNFGAN